MSERYGPLHSDCCQTGRRRRSIGLGKYVSLFFEMAIAVGTFWFVAVASAAEITMGSSWVVLEGPIEVGDYDKLRDFLVAKRDYGVRSWDPFCDDPYLDGCPEAIYLASPGGDVAEAMKIGRLMRALGWEALAPTRFPIDPQDSVAVRSLLQTEIRHNHLEDPNTDFMCASACFFIFVGGISRDSGEFGDTPRIGMHRPYLPTERLKELSGSQAIATASNEGNSRSLSERNGGSQKVRRSNVFCVKGSNPMD
jgi:hypothetical protein